MSAITHVSFSKCSGSALSLRPTMPQCRAPRQNVPLLAASLATCLHYDIGYLEARTNTNYVVYIHIIRRNSYINITQRSIRSVG